MTCEQIIDKIPLLIRREEKTQIRIQIIEHLRSCTDCREEYLSQLKLFYTLDKELVSEKPSLDKTSFRNSIEDKILKTNKNKIRSKHLWYYISAAAVLLCFFVIFPYLSEKDSDNIAEKPQGENVIQTALIDEDWVKLNHLLTDSTVLQKHADESIPLPLLIDKLERLQNQGIHSIDYIDLFNHANEVDIKNDQELILVKNESKQIYVNDLVQNLEQVKSFKNEITLEEISSFLEAQKEGEVKS